MLETLGLLVLLAVAVAVHRGQTEARHRRTDPVCTKYRAPRTALGRWWHDRGRGKSCPVCSPPYSPSRDWGGAIKQADIPRSFAAGLTRNEGPNAPGWCFLCAVAHVPGRHRIP